MLVPQANPLSNPSAERDGESLSPALHEQPDPLLAPIALFVYNRPEHTRRTVEALRANDLARQSDLFVFADGPKNDSGALAVKAVRDLMRTIDGFKSVTITERERNLGLSKSVISGVTQLCNEYGRAIAVEDDLLTAPDFLSFMNRALQRYALEPKIFSIGGFNFSLSVPEDYTYDAYCTYRSISWGWGTWKDRWEKADWNVPDYASFSRDKNQQRLFNRGGEDLTAMLALQMAGKIDSWSIRWDYVHFQHSALALLPVVSRVCNIGFDGTGIHCHHATMKQPVLADGCKREYRFPNTLEAERFFAAEIQRLHRTSFARKLVRYLRHQVGRA